ncbi:MAG: hypothetical protein NZ805_13265 [Armatimonadetes bacterium]|nr:hypothetical protein [Armatimonadota bacterium]MDW8028778.1 hypothetical protein [Armatimonadota bacterium]
MWATKKLCVSGHINPMPKVKGESGQNQPKWFRLKLICPEKRIFGSATANPLGRSQTIKVAQKPKFCLCFRNCFM